MRPDDCVGSNDSRARESWPDKGAEDERAKAWHAVFELMVKRNPSFANRADRGMDSALIELRRLYDIEARYALLALRNEYLGEGNTEPKR